MTLTLQEEIFNRFKTQTDDWSDLKTLQTRLKSVEVQIVLDVSGEP